MNNENKQKIVIPEECCRESSSYGSLSREEKQPHYIQYAEDPRQKHSGMTEYGACGMTERVAGFTLVELLVVVLIIGILAAVALPQYNKAVAKARAGSVLSLLADITQAEEVYHLANQQYTTDLRLLDLEIPSSCQLTADENNEGSAWYCSNKFRIVSSVQGSVINAVYCPESDGTKSSCQADARFQLGFAAAYTTSTQNPALTKRCWVPDAATHGQVEVCKSLGKPVTCGSKTCYEL